MFGSRATMALVAAGLVTSAMLHAQDATTAADTAFNPSARLLLQRAAAPWVARGFTGSAAPRFGALQQREADTVPLTLEPRRRYTVVGVCDEDCGDLDFVLFDDAGKAVAVDSRSDSHPAISVVPTTAATYRLRVLMVKCSTPPCYYAVQLLEKAEPASGPP